MNPAPRILLTTLLALSLAGPAQAQFVATPYLSSNVGGSVAVETGGRLGIGGSVGYYLRSWLGVEADVALNPHFFRDERVAHLVPAEGVDQNTTAALFMGNVVSAFCVSGAAGRWCPYGTVGVGLIRTLFDGVVHDGSAGENDYDSAHNHVGLSAGAGVMHSLTDLVGLRADMRYFHAFVDESTAQRGYPKDYGFWRLSVGVTFGFPR
jgi:opacity protein-like surface antigen